MSTMQEVNTLSSEQRSEILRGFKEAKAPLKHIKVMADLYDVSARAIKKVLIDAGIAPYLLELLEEGENEITHPQVAARIAREYDLTVDEYHQLVHPKRRHGKIPKIKQLSEDIYQAWRDGHKEAGHE